MADTPRIQPAGPVYRDEEAAELRKWMAGSDREPLTLFRTLVREPALAAAMRGMGGHMLRSSNVDARTRELVILRVCARLACTILALAGWYHAICFVANGSRLAREPWAAELPADEGGPAPRGVSGVSQGAPSVAR